MSMEILNLILVIVFSIGVFAFCIWFVTICNNHIDNIIDGSSKKQFFFLFLIVFLSFLYFFLLSIVITKNEPSELLLKIYSLFSQTSGVDNVQNLVPDQLKLFSLLVSFTGSIIFSGLLISTFNNSIQRRITNVKNGDIRYRSLRKHDVVIGDNELTFAVIQFLMQKSSKEKRRKKRIVIITNHALDKIRDIRNQLDKKDKHRMIIYHGNIHDKNTLSDLRLRKCRRIVILGDNVTTKCDSGNILILNNISEILSEKRNNQPKDIKECYVSYYDDSYLLKYCHDMGLPSLHIFPFNFYEMWANKIWGYGHLNKLINSNIPFQYSSLSQNKIAPASNNYVNVIILGFSVMARELIKTAINICHYANYDEETGSNKTKITVISNDENNINDFKSRYSGIELVPDVECSFISLSPICKDAQQKIVELIHPSNAISTIAVCSEDAERNYMLATQLPVEVYEKEIQIVVEYFTYSEYIEKMHSDTKKYSKLRFFGFMNRAVDMNENLKTAQFFLKVLDILYDRNINRYPYVPVDIEIKEIDTEKAWHRYKIDNRRQTTLAFTDALFSMLESMGLQIFQLDEKITNDKYCPELLGEWFDSAKHRQMLAWNLLAGYRPTNSPDEDDNWKLNKVSTLFPLSMLEKYANKFEDVQKTCHFNQMAFLTWLSKNNFFLFQRYKNLNKRGLYAYPCEKLFPESDLRLLYSPMTRKAVWINKEIAKEMEFGRTIDQKLQDIVNELTDFIPLIERREKVQIAEDYTLLTVLPNQKCNLNCSYCYSSGGRSNTELSFEKLKITIDHFIENKEHNKPLSISFMGGGEPMMSWDLVREGIQYALKKAGLHKKRIDFTIITNGTIMTDEMMIFISDNNINISISFEIIEDIQNKQRGKYMEVIETLNKLIQRKIIPQINATITPENVDRMEEMYNLLESNFPEISKMMFEPVIDVHSFQKANDLAVFLKKYADNFLLLYWHARQESKSLTSFPYLRTVFPVERSCPGEFCLTADGKISGCYCISTENDPGYANCIYGEVSEKESKVNIRRGRFKNLIEDNVYSKKKCEDCIVKWNCGGGCFYLRNCYPDDFQEVFCDFTRYFAQKVVLQRFEWLYQKQYGNHPKDDMQLNYKILKVR